MRCPGQDSRYWGPGAVFEVQCPQCGHKAEFFKDESTRRCKRCGHKLVNPKMDFGCAVHCKFAEQCLGDLPPELVAQRGELLKDRVAIEMKRYFKNDFKRIGHATKVARYAEQIAKGIGADKAVVISAAYLHDIGIHEAQRKYQSTAAHHQEEEGPSVARDILERLGADPRLTEEVCDIIGHHHHPRHEESADFKAVYDANLIVNLQERQAGFLPLERQDLEAVIASSFLTEQGRALARELLLKEAKDVGSQG